MADEIRTPEQRRASKARMSAWIQEHAQRISREEAAQPVEEEPGFFRDKIVDPASTGLRYIDRATRLAGLGIGTAVAAGPVGLPFQAFRLLPGEQKWIPKIENIPSAFRDFADLAKQGDWDAAIAAYQDQLEAPPGYWGAAEAAGALLPTGGPALVGAKLMSKAPAIAGAAARLAPTARGAVRARAAMEPAVRGAGKVLRAPWRAEEAVFGGALKGLGWAGRGIARPITSRFRRPVAEGVERVAEEAPEGAVTPTAARVAPDVPVTPTTATSTPEEVVEQILDNLGFTSTPERMTKEWPFGKVPGKDLAAGVTGAPLRGQRQLASTTRATRKGVELEIRERKKALNDMRIAQRRSAGLGTKRKVLASYKRAIEFQEEEIKRLANMRDAMPVPYQPVPRERALVRLGEEGLPERARNDLVQAIQKLEPRYIAEERARILPGILRKFGSTESEYLLLQRSAPGIDYFDVDRLVREAVDKRLASIRKAGEKRIDEIEAGFREKLIGRPTRKRPPQREQAQPIQKADEVPVRAETKLPTTNMLGLKQPVKPKPFSWWREKANMVESILQAPFRGLRVPKKDYRVDAIFKETDRARETASSQSANIGAKVQSRAEDVFTFDSQGRIPSLAGTEGGLRGSPTLADVAARLPVYSPRLSSGQRSALQDIRNTMRIFEDFYAQLDVPVGTRPDIMDGGFYIPRGRTTKDGLEVDWAIDYNGPNAKAIKKAGFQKTAKFNSQSEGISQGYIYPPLRATMATHARDVFRKAIEKHTVDSFKALEEAGAPLGRTLKKTADGKFTVSEGQATINLPGLEGRSFPAELARSANEVLKDMDPATGLEETAVLLNNMYRFTRATADNSGPGIQGLLALATKPSAFIKALRVNLRAWWKNGDSVLGRYINDFDGKARVEGRISSIEWNRHGLRTGGAQTEMTIGAEATGKMGKLGQTWGIRHANRAYGYFGDSLRLEWADDVLKTELAKGRNLKELAESGDLARIAEAVNNATGYSRKRTLGRMGDLVFFAPRFLQSRLETVTKAGMGLRPGAAIDQKIARDSIMRLVAGGVIITFTANELLGNKTDTRMFVNGRYNSNFMRIRFQGRDWSVFGTWESLLRAIVVSTKGMSPQDAVRGMSSGVVANAWDMISGETFMGEQIYGDWGPISLRFGRRMLENITPFAMEEVPSAAKDIGGGLLGLDPERIAGGISTIGGEFIGAKSAPMSVTDARDDESRTLFGSWYSDLENFQQEIVDTAEDVIEKKERRPMEPSAWEQISRDQTESYWALTELPGSQYKITNEYRKKQAEYRGRRIQEGIDVEFKKPDDPTAEERALLEYYDLYEKETVSLGGGVIDSKAFSRELDRLRRKWTPSQNEYVLRNTNVRPIPRALYNRLDEYTKRNIRRSQDARERYLRKIGRGDLVLRSRNAFFIPGRRKAAA